MSEAEFVAACVLHHEAFPKDGRSLEAVLDKKRPVWMGDDVVPGPLRSVDAPLRYAVRDASGRWLANAAVIRRRISTSAGPMVVLGLLDVATLPAARGQGLGEVLVRAAMGPVDRGELPVCLFETGPAKGFYERLGARVIANEVVDSTAEDPQAPGFHDEFAMIYPGDADWPSGPIDLLGPGY